MNTMGSIAVVSGLRVKPEADEQIEKGEQLLQSFLWSEPDVCAVCSSSSHLSKMEQGTTALNKM